MPSDKATKQVIWGYALGDGRIISKRDIDRHVIEKESKQTDPKSWYTKDQLVEPPYPPSQLLGLLEANSIHHACCHQIASDVVGLGWTLDPVEEGKENKAERDRALAFLEQPNPDFQLRDILRKAQVDHESIGWMGLEIARAEVNKKPVLEMYWVPAQTLRIHRDRWKFRQAWSSNPRKRQWFKLYGRKEVIDRKTGLEADKGLAPENQANELIWLANYTSKDTYYGIPAVIPALGSMLAMGEMRDYNLAFFQNHAIPEFVILLEGAGEVTEPLQKEIQRILQESFKGSANEHKTAVLSCARGVTIKIEKLTAEIRDASFRLYRQSCVEDILVAHRVPPYRVAIAKVGALGGTDNRDANEIYKWGVVRPRQLDLQEVINRLLREVLDVKSLVFRFKELDTRDRDAEQKRINELFDRGAINPNEIRAKQDLGEPYPEGNQFYVNGVPVGAMPEQGVQKSVGFPGTITDSTDLMTLLRLGQVAIRGELERRKRMED